MGQIDIAVQRQTSARTSLRIEGRLRPGWCGSLATGLANLEVDIVRGQASAVAAGIWRGEFELSPARTGVISVAELGRMLEAPAVAGFTSPIELVDYRLEPVSSFGGSLHLEVAALDRVGLLAALLRRLAYHALFPAVLRLETVDRLARDELWLRSTGGSVPPAGTARAVTASLDSLVRSREVRPAGWTPGRTPPYDG